LTDAVLRGKVYKEMKTYRIGILVPKLCLGTLMSQKLLLWL